MWPSLLLSGILLKIDCESTGPFTTQAPGGGVFGFVDRLQEEDKGAGTTSTGGGQVIRQHQQQQQLLGEDWYHGPISRMTAEALLIHVRKQIESFQSNTSYFYGETFEINFVSGWRFFGQGISRLARPVRLVRDAKQFQEASAVGGS